MPGVDFGEVEHRALAWRAQADLHPEDAVPDVCDVIERLGIPVAVSPFGVEGPDGIYACAGDDRLIVLNSSKYLPRFRFTACHELGHAAYEDMPHVDVDAQVGTSTAEKRANAFAANFLIPVRALKAAMPSAPQISSDAVLAMSVRFGVSYPVVVYRLHNAGLIKAARRDELLSAAPAAMLESLRDRPGNETRLPTDYVMRAHRAYSDQEIAFQRLAELLRRDPDELARAIAGSGLLHPEDEPAGVGIG